MIQRARMTWAIRSLDSFSRSSSSVVGTSVEIYCRLEKSISPPPRGSFHAYRQKNGENSILPHGGGILESAADVIQDLANDRCLDPRRSGQSAIQPSPLPRQYLPHLAHHPFP